jgi:molybdopterin converting factor small subunit
MAIQVNVHKTLRQYTNDQELLETEGQNVGECIDALIKIYPGLKDALFGKRRKLHSYIEIYVNRETAYPDELAKTVKDGDEIHITFMLAGG